MFWKLKSGLIADQLVYRIHCIYWHIELLSEFTIDMTEKMCNQEALTKQALTERNLKFAGSREQRRWLCILPGTASVTRMTCPPFTGERALKSHKGHPVTTNSCLSARFALICLIRPAEWRSSFCERCWHLSKLSKVDQKSEKLGRWLQVTYESRRARAHPDWAQKSPFAFFFPFLSICILA